MTVKFERGTWALYFASVIGCATSNNTPPEEPLPPATPRQLAPERALDRLGASVEALETNTSAPAPRELAEVLQNLADAMERLSHATNLRVQEVAQRLAGSSPASLSHAGLLKQALTLVLQSLVTIPGPPGRQTEYQSALRALRESTHAIDELATLPNQRPRVLAALHAATDAVFLAHGEEPPFGEPERLEQPPEPIGSFETELERARDEVSQLAQTKQIHSSKASAQALTALANLVAAADTGNRLDKQVAEIRFEAERLERAEPTEFGQTAWIRRGLESVLDALAALYERAHTHPSPWIRTARKAVASIDEQTSVSFQCAAVQDAFRATVDAFAAWEHSSAERASSP
jgi:translation initiation factor 2B subunit (eIF-2B alpha/beta/delta family)